MTFLGKKETKKTSLLDSQLFFFGLLMEIFEMRYYDSQTKIVCQSYDPGKLEVQITHLYKHFVYIILVGHKYIFVQ